MWQECIVLFSNGIHCNRGRICLCNVNIFDTMLIQQFFVHILQDSNDILACFHTSLTCPYLAWNSLCVDKTWILRFAALRWTSEHEFWEHREIHYTHQEPVFHITHISMEHQHIYSNGVFRGNTEWSNAKRETSRISKGDGW